MKHTRIKPISAKQAVKNAHWKKITDERAKEEDYVCQWCGKRGQRTDMEGWDYLDGHHIIPRRYNIHTKENCYIVHRVRCHEQADKYIKGEINES